VRTLRAALIALVACVACGPTPPPPLLTDAPTAHELRAEGGDARRGDALLRDRRLGRTGLTCESCHTLQAGGEALRPAPPLPGVASRAALWSGHAPDLATAVGLCLERYLAVAPRDVAAVADLVAALRALPDGPVPAPTWARVVPDALDGGRAEAGRAVYARACAGCHDDGPGPALAGRPWPPTVLAESVRGLDRPRHPGTLMPPFPLEVIDDASLRDLVAWLAEGDGGDSRAK
jgi:mono/diheme cytochrome c family protein